MGVWGSFRIAAAALKTPTRNGYNAQGVNLTLQGGGGGGSRGREMSRGGRSTYGLTRLRFFFGIIIIRGRVPTSPAG